jgi:hypothetical protein
VAIFEHADGGSSELAFQDTNQQNQIRIGTADSGFRVFTADEERMRIDSNGNVGIGTTNPLAKFDIRTKGDTFNDGLIVKTNTGGQRSVRMWVDGSTQKAHIGAGQGTQDLILNHAGGYVGIGTTDPTSLLHVKTSGTGGALVIESDDDGSTYAPDFLLFRNSETPAADDNLGEIKFRGRNDDDPQSSIDYTMIRSRIKSPTNNNERGELTFWTRGGSSLFQRMVLDAHGNVGIGTANPAMALEINIEDTSAYAGSKPANALRLRNHTVAAPNSYVGLELLAGNQNATGMAPLSRIYCVKEDISTTAGSLTFSTRKSDSVVYERMRIDSNGNVGIGTTDPDGKLEIEKDSYGTLDAGQGHMVLDTVGVAREKGKGPFINFRVPTTSSTSEDMANIGAVCSDSTASSRKADLVFWTRNNTINERMRIDSSGNVGIGTTDPSASRLDVWQTEHASDSCIKTVRPGTADRKHLVFFNDNGIVGDIKTNGLETAYNTSSDYRLKENVVELTDALDRVCQLKPSRFNFIADKNKTVDGFLAHEVQEIVPEAISGEKDAIDEDGKPDYQGIDQSKLVPLLTKAIQEQQQIIDQLKSQNESLAAQNVDFESRISKLEQQ